MVGSEWSDERWDQRYDTRRRPSSPSCHQRQLDGKKEKLLWMKNLPLVVSTAQTQFNGQFQPGLRIKDKHYLVFAQYLAFLVFHITIWFSSLPIAVTVTRAGWMPPQQSVSDLSQNGFRRTGHLYSAWNDQEILSEPTDMFCGPNTPQISWYSGIQARRPQR